VLLERVADARLRVAMRVNTDACACILSASRTDVTGEPKRTPIDVSAGAVDDLKRGHVDADDDRRSSAVAQTGVFAPATTHNLRTHSVAAR
jgi:hypothetical protein